MVIRGKQVDWKKEQSGIEEPWGWPNLEHKESFSPIAEKNGHYIFTYDKLMKGKRALEPNAIDKVTGRRYHTQLYASLPYRPEGTSTCVKRLSQQDLIKMDFGIKQKGPMYFTNDKGEACYTVADHVEGKEAFDKKISKETAETLSKNSMHGMVANATAITFKSTQKPRTYKSGLGPKFYNRGANACINAIVTRYDRHGNVQIMAMLRPKTADSDPGDFQMSAGCIFFAEDMTFNGRKIDKMTSTPYGVTQDIDPATGQLRGKGLAYARAAIYSKLWHGENYIPLIDQWNFDKVLEGVVDDVSNTSQAWVETSYNVHHVTGYESDEELAMLSNAKVNKERANVGFGVWRNIDPNPRDPDNVHSQIYVEDAGDFKCQTAKHDGVAKKFDPFAEFDLWHGEHSFVASLISEYVKARYKFEKPAGSTPFGKCRRRES